MDRTIESAGSSEESATRSRPRARKPVNRYAMLTIIQPQPSRSAGSHGPKAALLVRLHLTDQAKRKREQGLNHHHRQSSCQDPNQHALCYLVISPIGLALVLDTAALERLLDSNDKKGDKREGEDHSKNPHGLAPSRGLEGRKLT